MKKKAFFISSAILIIVMILSAFNKKDKSELQVGDMVPSFTLQDQFGQKFDVNEFIGKMPMVIYFYPKDDTPGCTKEACSFRDAYEKFTDRNIKVIGISADDVKSHKNFADKYNLPFTLLADTDNEVRNLFGVKSNMFGLIPGRVTYVVDKSGKIIFIYDSQLKAEKHIEESIKAIDSK